MSIVLKKLGLSEKFIKKVNSKPFHPDNIGHFQFVGNHLIIYKSKKENEYSILGNQVGRMNDDEKKDIFRILVDAFENFVDECTSPYKSTWDDANYYLFPEKDYMITFIEWKNSLTKFWNLKTMKWEYRNSLPVASLVSSIDKVLSISKNAEFAIIRNIQDDCGAIILDGDNKNRTRYQTQIYKEEYYLFDMMISEKKKKCKLLLSTTEQQNFKSISFSENNRLVVFEKNNSEKIYFLTPIYFIILLYSKFQKHDKNILLLIRNYYY